MKITTIDKLCWIIVIVFVVMMFCYGCKTQKNVNPCSECPTFTSIKIPYHDTIYFDRVHEHIELDCKNYCFYIEEFSFPYTDTIYLDIPKETK